MVQRGKRERRAAEATGEDSAGRKEAERRRGWERWRAKGKVPKRQSRETQAAVVTNLMAATEEEREVAEWVMVLLVWERVTGKEKREADVVTAAAMGRVGGSVAEVVADGEEGAGAVATGTVLGHLVVNRGKRVGSKAAGLSAKAVSRAVAKKVS